MYKVYHIGNRVKGKYGTCCTTHNFFLSRRHMLQFIFRDGNYLLFSRCCDQISDRKQLESGRFCFDSQLGHSPSGYRRHTGGNLKQLLTAAAVRSRGGGEGGMLVIHLISLFNSVWDISLWDNAAHIQDVSTHLC